MDPDGPNEIERREFLRRAGLAAAGTLLASGAAGEVAKGAAVDVSRGAAGDVARGAAAAGVSVLVDPTDPIAAAPPSRWAVDQLRLALSAHRIPVRLCERLGECDPSHFTILATGSGSGASAATALPPTQRPAEMPEALAIAPGTLDARPVLFAAGRDVRGLVFALTELADLVTYAPPDRAMAALAAIQPMTERPANPIRSCMRLFCSDVEDKPWFGDRDFWNAYLSMLVTQRFNRFNLAFGLGYDFPTGITDAYLYFAYPFLLDVPGYNVRATNLSDAERDANLERLRAISDAAAARGLHFQLGIWTHAYEWIKSPDANHRIEGLTPATHGAYCRDALTQLLKACPSISGVTFRIHGESGVAEGSYDFWKTVFDGVRRADRRIEIDMHAKGMDRRTIETAVASGMPIVISPKFWAEHMGLPYHQAWIRPTELPKRERGEGPFANSSGSRSFLRYGYGDLLAEDRPYRILHRIWPGTQRLLQWGDPATAAAYGRVSSFCGSDGCEPMEPLTFKGRKGSGLKGPRTARVEARSEPASDSAPPSASVSRHELSRYDFETYLYTYRLWGRLLYNPDAPPDTWQRLLRAQHGAAAASVESALAASSRVLPLVTTSHMPSAANNSYWPEMYANMSIVDGSHPEPYTDTPTPKRFGAVSPLDPQLFSSVDACVDEWLQGHPSGRYTPIDVATRLDDLASLAARHLTEASSKAGAQPDAAFQRVALDITVQADLARFFALKLRAAVLYALFERTGEPRARARAVELYRSARDAWGRIAEQTNHHFVDDVTFGPVWYQRGHWRDRLAAIDKDIAAMAADVPRAPRAAAQHAERFDLIDAAVDRAATRPSLLVRHVPPSPFRRGQSVTIDVAVKILGKNVEKPASGIRLRYRRTNQAEPWQGEPMTPHGDGHRATVPPEYADSPFALQYYFELLGDVPTVVIALYPGFDQTWCNQPYFVVRQAASSPPPRSAGYMRNTPNFGGGIGAL